MHFASSTATVTTPQNEVVEKTVVTPSEKVDSIRKKLERSLINLKHKRQLLMIIE